MGLGGGILGAIIGGVLGGPWGAAIGGGIGYLFGERSSGRIPEEMKKRSERSMSLLFQALGKLAKADGRVSQEEANFVRQLMTSMRLSADLRSRMKREFNCGRDSSAEFIDIVRQLDSELTAGGVPAMVKHDIVNIFCALAAVDRVVSPEERRMLHEAGAVLHAAQAVEEFFRSSGSSSSGSSGGTRRKSGCTPEEAFSILGVSRDASADEVKKAWRKKVKEYHPDRVQARGVSAEDIDRAKEEIQKINNAYEALCKARGW